VAVTLPPGSGLGATLLRLVADARSQGLDPEAALRQAALALAAEIRTTESESLPPG
jgi:XTP/dITP diphosphohydrolase